MLAVGKEELKKKLEAEKKWRKSRIVREVREKVI